MTKVADQFTSAFCKLRERLDVRAAKEISARDRDLIIEVLVFRAALLKDLSAGSTHADKSASNWLRTVLGLTTLDVEQYASDWKLCREVITSVDFLHRLDDVESCRCCFKRSVKQRIHYKWISSSVLGLMREGDGWYRRVNQWIVFDARVNLQSLDLTSECCSEYLEFEDGLKKQTYDQTLINVCRMAARDMFGDFNITDFPFRPKHGNGATAELSRSQADIWHKNRQFKVDSEVITYLKYRIPETDWHDYFYVPYRGLRRTSELVCVPKAMTANRTISKEPTTLQFLQQDVFAALDDYFNSRPDVAIDLHDQERSRMLAEVGSGDGSYATIDLSSASDSVTISLVEAIFDGLPILYPLQATRSTSVHVRSKSGDVDSVVEEMEKFAPMGSAVCFPTECMVFAICCETAIRCKTGRRSRRNDYVVYGDDIVIRTKYAEAVIEVLEALHFTVNRSKSFYDDSGDHFFREACGVECLDGENITPLRLSRRLVSLSNNDSQHQAGLGVGMVDLYNRTYLYGFFTLRSWITTLLNKYAWFHSLLRISESDYRDFAYAIRNRLQPWVRVVAPFVITDDNCDTQWRSLAVSERGASIQVSSALVTCCKPRGRRAYHDNNDYYTWSLSAVTRKADEDIFALDDTQIVTIRPRDLVWSTQWVALSRAAHF
jgi:hypothetical protein